MATILEVKGHQYRSRKIIYCWEKYYSRKYPNDRFSYNNIAFAKESENSVKVIYKQEIVEDSQKTKDIGLSFLW